MKAAFEEGRWCRPAPLGYQSVGTKAKGQPNIVPLESEAAHVAKSFELVHLGHEGASAVLRTMTSMGLRSKKGKKLSLHVFLKMLRNPVYIALMKSQKWGARKGLQQPIVSEPVFRNVQLILSGKKPIAAPYQRNRADFPLRRFLRCAECSLPLTGGSSKSATGKTYDYYSCYRCRAVKSQPTEKVTEQFLNLLRRLRPDARFLANFETVLRQEWEQRTNNNSALVRKLTMDLQEARSSREKLLVKCLNDDKAILPHFEQFNRKFSEDIATLETQIEEAEAEKVTFDQLWEFSRSLLIDMATAWQRADVDQKQRVQNVLFPSGLKYHPQDGILNVDNDCLFNQLEGFVSGKITLVRPERFELPT
jgi:site-specific DNA recombinase